MTDIKLRLACWDYDRIEPLANGKVKPTGIDLNVEKLWLQEIFYRMLTKKEFDLSELSFGAYTVSLFEENPPFIAIPVFPSRMFRHGSIYINKDSGIERPEDLMGKRIGLPEYRQTAVVWIKGFLKDIYGVENTAVKYYTGPLEKANSKYFYNLSKTDVTKLYKDVDIRKINDGKTLSDMLLYGELDALYSAIEPSGFKKNDGKVVRLYSNPKDVEMKYFGDTGIFPIMHVIAIRREIYEENRWVAQSLYDAFLQAKNIVVDELIDATGALKYSLPWLRDYIEETVNLMGRDYWPYGVNKNMTTIKKFIGYMHEQGIIPRKLNAEGLFAEEVQKT